jgi:UDP-N-acetylmuramoyl-L-alanyl-D-glutamate--2,6-diaminopimelate ligase
MILSDVLSAIKPIKVAGSTDIDITDIQIDSRKVSTGALFVAVAGTHVDGHTFIPKP